MLDIYADIYASFRYSDSESSSSSFVEILMETSGSFSEEVMGYDQSSMDEVEIVKLRSLRKVPSNRNEDDVVLEACIPGERVCMSRPKGV